MENNYTVMDMQTWPRAAHANTFRGWMQPSIYIAFEVDVTGYIARIRAKKLSFTLAMTYEVCRCANSIENFRYRFLDGDVVLFDKVDTLFSYLNKETELFRLIRVPMCDGLEEYVEKAAETAAAQEASFMGSPGCDIIRCTAIPWVSFTQMSSAYSGRPDYSTPVIAWGKYHDVNGRMMMPVSVQANHAFVDGLHIGKFAEALQKQLDREL